MAIRFNKLIRPDQPDIESRYVAEDVVRSKTAAADDTMVFMSHKTGDVQAEIEAEYIASKHGVKVYMAEWDDHVDGDSSQLPDYIMDAIRRSDGFLVHVIARIAVSMWIGYEIGGAHAMEKSRAKIMYEEVGRLPSVVDVLDSLRSRNALDRWIVNKVCMLSILRG